jgi:hypothetical protein
LKDAEDRLAKRGELSDALEMDASSQSSNGTQSVEATRRKWSIEDRQRVVQASLKSGTTVNAVAKVYER